MEIAKSIGAEICYFSWTNDFAAARNVALDRITSDWVLSMDADEALDSVTAPRVRDLINRPLGPTGFRAW